jgi:hypothetical protein
MARPSALAVFKFTVSTNFRGCWIGSSPGKDQVGLERDDFGRQGRKARKIAIRQAVVELEVAALDPSRRAQRVDQC